MQPSVLADDLGARAQPQVEGVAEHDFRAHVLQFRRVHALDRAVGADRHEHGCVDRAVGKGQAARAGQARRARSDQTSSLSFMRAGMNIASP